MQNETAVFERVSAILIEVLSYDELSPPSLSSQSSLLELGFDSLKLADLVVALESQLGILDFPMQAWIDAEAERDGPRYTLASLVQECTSLLAGVGRT